jgi:hypothetical protein
MSLLRSPPSHPRSSPTTSQRDLEYHVGEIHEGISATREIASRDDPRIIFIIQSQVINVSPTLMSVERKHRPW